MIEVQSPGISKKPGLNPSSEYGMPWDGSKVTVLSIREFNTMSTTDIKYHGLWRSPLCTIAFKKKKISVSIIFQRWGMESFFKIMKKENKCKGHICLLSEKHQGSPRFVFGVCLFFVFLFRFVDHFEIQYSDCTSGCVEQILTRKACRSFNPIQVPEFWCSSDCAYFICIYKVCFGNSFCDLGLNDSLKYICKHS